MLNRISWQQQTPKGIFYSLAQRPALELFELKQVHGDQIIDLRVSSVTSHATGDGVIASYNTSIIPVIKTADCLPLLLLGPQAFALLHAGWRALATPIMANPLLQGLDIEEIYLGPSIGPTGFEVSREFRENFPDSPNFVTNQGNLAFNLWNEALLQAQRYFPKARFVNSNECTWSDKRYHSFRRDKTSQRNWNLFLPSNLGKLD